MKKKIIILTISLIGITGIIVGVSLAFFSVGGSQETANTFTSGCLSISLTDESTAINLENAYPVTDVEGLEGTSYDFTITNNCDSSTNYQINLESLNQVANSLNADYIKVALYSDTVDNIISTLSDNTSATPTIDNAYESYNLYTGSLGASESKTYHLKIWVDYDATVEQAANKVYSSKINVIANPETTIIDTLEAQFSLSDKTLTANLTNNVTSASYCVTTDNICTPNTGASIVNNSFSVELQGNNNKQMVCTKLNGTSKIICSNLVDIKVLLNDTILANKDIQTRNNFTSTLEGDTTGIIYQTTDWTGGTSYYFAGNPSDNWVYFAGYYWRIIRINGDKSIRIIYQGEEPNITGNNTIIGTSRYNEEDNLSEYVGFKYTLNQQYGYEVNSTILNVLNEWYESNLSKYEQYLDPYIGFCNDRNSNSNDFNYKSFENYINKGEPSLQCNEENLFSKTNNKLKNPIGLITLDEIIFGGYSWNGGTSNNYLYTDTLYWTMTPSKYQEGQAYVWYVHSIPFFGTMSTYVTSNLGVRPVINLSADVGILSGNGTIDDPYVVQTN